jgi:hypothetical protein
MQFFVASLIAFAIAASPALGVTVSYDNTYDVASNSLAIVACSDGENGMLTKGFTTFGSLPKFPYIGGAAAVEGYDSANCGTCWALTYKGKTINVLAIDHTDNGFNIAQSALDALTNGQAVHLGRIDATVKQVDASVCGIH